MKKNWGIYAKRILVTALTLSMLGGSVDMSGFTVSAQTTQEKQTTVTVTGFAELPENIREQQLPVGAQESDICLPESLTVTVERTVAEDKEGDAGEQNGTEEDGNPEKEDETEENTDSGEQGGTEGSTGSEGQDAADDTGSGEQGGAEGSTGSEGQGAAGGTGSGEQSGAEGSTGPEGQGMTGEAGNAAGEQGAAGQDNAAPENGNNSTDNGQAAGEQDSSGEGLVGRIADWFFAPMTVHAAENPAGEAAEADTEETTGNGDTSGTTEEVSLAGITWELDQDESDAAEFDASEAADGFCYVYTPVLPDKDKDGNTLVVGDDVELPAIYVLVGEYGIAAMAEDDVAEVTVGNGTPTTYPTVNEAFDAIQTAISNASGDAAQNITLKFLADTIVTGLDCELDGKEKTSLTIDMNEKNVGIAWESGGNANDFYLKMTNIEATLTGTGTLSATVNIGEKANLTVKDAIEYQGTLRIQESGTAALKNLNGNGSVPGNIEIQDGSCKITGGTYNMIEVYSGAKLEVSGDTTGIRSLCAYYAEANDMSKRAEIALFGGSYDSIKFSGSMDSSNLENEVYQCAIIDMLADGYKFYNSKDNETEVIPERTITQLQNVKVLSEPEVIVSFQITKTGGKTETKDFATWDKAMSYLSDPNNATEFAAWKKVEIILQKDASISRHAEQMVSSDKLSAELVLCSASDKIYTLSADSDPSYKAYTALHTNGQKLTVENIKTSGASIQVEEGTVTIRSGADLTAYGNSSKGTIDVKGSTLILEEGASVSSTETNKAIRMAATGTLRIKKGAQITKGEVYITGSNNESIVVIEEGAELSAIGSSSGAAKACVYCNLDSTASDAWRTMISGKVYFPIECNGVTLDTSGSDSNIKEYEGTIYGRFYRDPETHTSSNTKIKVPDTVCSYERTDGTKTAVDADHTFLMPSAKVKLLKHSPDASGSCPHCGKTDLAKAYKAGKLQINGLTGRTYDSWPQTLTGIILTGTDGSTTTLKGPSYQSGKELAQDSRNTENADLTNADYALVYENNINAYDKKQGESGFDEAKAPKVTIIGQGKYTGTIEYYFTIGQGKLLTKDFKASDSLTYNGKQQAVLQYGTLAYEPDGTDADADVPMGGLSEIDASISVCTGKTVDTDGFASVAAQKIEYSTDNGSTWTEIDENATDESRQNNYYITDAGIYNFQIRATDGENAASTAQTLTAAIQPKSLTSEGISLDSSQKITVYYTGKPIIPTNKDSSITDNNGVYVLEKGKDFTISATNNTDVGNATLTFTGMGNYTGTLTDTFSIDYAFKLAQTTASTDHWYNTDVPAVFGLEDNTTGGTADAANQLVYRSEVILDTRYDQYHTELNGNVKLYSTLQDAIADTNAGYTFTGEGEQTVTLYGRDTAKGYISPVEVTVKIDKTAPTWADENGNVGNYGIQIKNNWWRTLLNTISFGLFYNDATLNIRISANDDKLGVRDVSGIDKYYYYVDTITNTADDMAAKTKTELDALAERSGFTPVAAESGSATIPGKLSSKGNYVVYAYAVDKAGNKSDYICTNGLVVDRDAPVLTITEPQQSEGTLKDTEATITINSDEAGTWEYFYVHESEFDDSSAYAEFCSNADSYIKNKSSSSNRPPFAYLYEGKWRPAVELGKNGLVDVEESRLVQMYSTELKAGENTLTITDLEPSEECKVWLIAIDKAGNITGDTSEPAETVTFTTTKAMPRITTLPQLSGVYGDTSDKLTVKHGIAKYNDSEISGTWTVESTDTTKLEVGTTKQYTVKFTPTDTDYTEAYVKVTPTIAKRPITIKVMDRSKIYKEPLPDITTQDGFLSIPMEQLATGDSDADVRGTLQLVTEATAESEVGTYPFTVTSDNPNYEVTAKYYSGNFVSGFTPKLEQQGTLTITPAAGALITGSGYTDTKTVTYGDAPFSLDVTANHAESRIAYVVTDEKNADGNAISAEDGHILSVSAEGMVTINRAGSAKIQISLPASKNYTEAVGFTVDVTINRKDVTVPELSRSYLYDRDSSDTIDLAALLPQDSGSVTYSISSWISSFFAMVQAAPSGKLYYTVKNGTIGDKGDIKVEVKTANYTINGNSGQITVKAALVDRKPIEPKTTVSVKNSTLTYGEPVSNLQFNSVTFVEQGTDKTVAGTLKWDNPDAVLGAGAQSVTWTFTPGNDEYQIVTGSLSITVERAVPKVTKAPVPGAYVYHPSNTLASDKAKAVLNAGAKVQGVVTDAQGRTVAGSWSWKETEIPNAGTHTYTAVFTPTDAANYETVEKPVTLTVEKAYVSIRDEIGSLQLPSYKHGEYLYNHELTTGPAYYAGKGGDYSDVDKSIAEVRGRYVWAAPETQVKYTDGKTLSTGYQAEYELEFIPDDTTNYAGTMETKNNWAVHKMAKVFLYKADNPPYRPSAQMTVARTCQKVSDVKLPQDWKWSGNDGDKLLEDNQAVSAWAEYTGPDADCYVNTFYPISITRSSCDHAQTEVKNARAATCSSEGSTGETWCKQCGEKLDDGCVLAKDATKHEKLTETIVRRATTSQTGLKVQECSACHYRKEVTIPKLSGGSPSQGDGSAQQPGTSDGNGQNTADGSGDGSGGSSTPGGNGGGQSAPPTQEKEKTQPPAERGNADKPDNTNRNSTEQKTEDRKPESGKPFIKGENGKEGWDVIHAELEAAGEGETVSVDMNGATTVPGEILGNISGKDITLVLDMGGGITWSINGKSFTKADPGDIDFGVTYGEQAGKTIPVDVINNVTGERYSMNLTLAYDGEFGFSAVLSINMDSSNAGLYANLFYYNPESGELEFMCAGQIGEDGSVELTFTHASDYTIVIDTEPMDRAGAEAGKEAETGDNPDAGSEGTIEPAKDNADSAAGWIILIVVILAVAAATGAVVLQKRRKQQ